MMTIVTCITAFHDMSLVALAAIVCGFGSWVTSRLYRHARNRSHRHAISWYLLTALTAGVSIWCTHFVAMLGFRPNVPVSFDLGLTLVSFAIAVLGSAIGVLVSTISTIRFAPLLGGALPDVVWDGVTRWGEREAIEPNIAIEESEDVGFITLGLGAYPIDLAAAAPSDERPGGEPFGELEPVTLMHTE